MQQHWKNFQKAIGSQPFPSTSSEIGNTGFLDLKPRNTSTQAKYDAMSPTWGGVALSESKGVTDIYKPMNMPIKHQK